MFWCGSRILSALLILLGLYVRLPWKVLGLYCLFLLPDFLPKPYAKKVRYGLLGVVLLVLAWVFLPAKPDPRWKPYALEDQIRTWRQAQEIPDSENAAVLYRDLLAPKDWEAMRTQLNRLDPKSAAVRHPWRRGDFPELADWLKENESVIEQLQAAAEYEKCWFGLQPQWAQTSNWDSVSNLRTAAGILLRSCTLDLAEGRTEPALQKLYSAAQLSSHLRQQQMLLSLLTSLRLNETICEVLKFQIIEGAVQPEQDERIQKILEKMDISWTRQWSAVMEFEKLTAKQMWAALYEVNEQGRTRLKRNGNAVLPVPDSIRQNRQSPTYLELVKGRLLFLLMRLFYPGRAELLFQEIDGIFDPIIERGLHPERGIALSEKDIVPRFEFNVQFILKLLHETSQGVYWNIAESYLRHQSQRRSVDLCRALRQVKEQHQTWPPDLDACRPYAPSEEIFTDPLSGNSYVYQRNETGFRLYSKGRNGIDDGGVYQRRLDRKTARTVVEKDDIPLWPVPEDGCL
ncbi:MAG TPA: hypothetical protein PLV55_00910 [Anaerohalosphaeraceae bacterium]|nr:hypothetical protein [Anaerohalosphaeraceae bacterium]HOL88891.1 hypothetical protein [Anaerohalosphaeraceae bacterium]